MSSHTRRGYGVTMLTTSPRPAGPARNESMMNSVNRVQPTTPCVCGWNTPDHHAGAYEPKECPAVRAATKRLFDEGLNTTRMTRWSNYYIDPNDVAVLVLEAVKAQQAEELAAAAAEHFESERVADVIPIGVKQVRTSSSPLSLDPHDSYYRPPYTGRAA